MSMRSTRAHCTLLARRSTLRTIYSSPHSRGHHCIWNRNVRASVMALGENARYCFVLSYSGLCCLWRHRSSKMLNDHAERHHTTLSQSERLVQNIPTYENPSKEASFTMGQKCPDLWHAICSLELEHDV